MKINKKDLEFEYFKRSNSRGGQKQNKTSSSVRLTHLPTGIVIESSEERSQAQNKAKALEKLEAELENLAEKTRVEKEQDIYNNKTDAGFSNQIRTYRLCGNTQNVVDHRTGVKHSNTRAVLDGDIDVFLKESLKEGK